MAGKGRRIDDLPEDDSCFEFSPGITVVRSFDSLGLKSDVLRGIYGYGFEKPSAVQQRAAQPIISGRDVIAQAPSGSGKTAMIAFTMLQLVDTGLRECQALILSPTRALAHQTEQMISTIGKDLRVMPHCCIGGSNLGDDIRRCERGVHVVSGTPGRVIDMIKRRSLRTRSIKALVLDEADEMLAQGFKEQIYDVYRYLPPDTQVVLVASTVPNDLLEMSRKFMVDPLRILARGGEPSIEGIKQFFVAVEREAWKFDTLTDLYDTLTITQAVVFVNTKRKADWLTDRLRHANLTVGCIHGGMLFKDIEAILADFRAGGSRVLVTMDSICRGLDMGRVALVINYDLPNDRELYLRRLSRAGGHGRKGVAINFIREDDVRVLRDIEQYYSSNVDEMPMNVADLVR